MVLLVATRKLLNFPRWQYSASNQARPVHLTGIHETVVDSTTAGNEESSHMFGMWQRFCRINRNNVVPVWELCH
jgi:hypothetical protein